MPAIDANPVPPAGRFCSVRDAQTELNVSKPTVHRLIASGHLAGVKVGRKRLVVRDSLDALASRLASGEDITTYRQPAPGWMPRGPNALPAHRFRNEAYPPGH